MYRFCFISNRSVLREAEELSYNLNISKLASCKRNYVSIVMPGEFLLQEVNFDIFKFLFSSSAWGTKTFIL